MQISKLMRNVFLGLGLMLAGCSVQPATLPQATLKPSATLLANTVTPRPTQTPTLVSPTATATATISPTVSPAEILNLMKTNGGCELPCWWGILPGKTTIETTKSFTTRFGNLAIHALRQETGNFRIWVPDGEVQPNIDVIYGPLQGEQTEWLRVRLGLDYKNDVGEYAIRDIRGDPQYLDYFPAYTIAALLTTYGKPNTILLNGDMVNEPGLSWVYALTLVYPTQGIWVEYFGSMDSMGGEQHFSLCPLQASVSLSLWQPGQYNSLEEMLAASMPMGGWGQGLGELTTLEEKTELTVDKFYEVFKDASYSTCFESPMERWYP